MPITLTVPYVPSVPTFNKVHLDALSIALEKTDYAKTNIQARVRLYYQDPVTNVKTFSTETQEVSIPDAEAWAVSLAQQGDMRGVNAAGYIKEIVALLVATQTTLGASTVS